MNETNNGPPKDMTPGELFNQLCALPRPGRPVDLPRKDPLTGESMGMVFMRVLTTQERLESMAEAERVTKLMLKEHFAGGVNAGQGQTDVYENEIPVQILWRAMRGLDDHTQLFAPTAKALRGAMTGDEIAVLMGQYYLVQAEVGPIVAHMTEKEMDNWLRVLAEGASSVPLGLLSSAAQMDLTLHSASRLLTLQTGIGSSTEPANDTSTDGEPDEAFSSADEVVEVPETGDTGIGG